MTLRAAKSKSLPERKSLTDHRPLIGQRVAHCKSRMYCNALPVFIPKIIGRRESLVLRGIAPVTNPAA